VPTLADRGCRVVSATDPHGRNLGFLDPEPLLFHSSYSSIILTRLSGPLHLLYSWLIIRTSNTALYVNSPIYKRSIKEYSHYLILKINVIITSTAHCVLLIYSHLILCAVSNGLNDRGSTTGGDTTFFSTSCRLARLPWSIQFNSRCFILRTSTKRRHSSLSSAEVTNAGRLTFTSQYVFMACSLNAMITIPYHQISTFCL
jgi:hypothetical protein